eukprot:tig00000692_g3207.t1
MSKPPGNSEAVRVVVRCRPMNKKEMDRNCESVLTFDTSSGMCSLRNPKADAKEPPKTFSFDASYDPNSTQGMVFKETAMPIVESTMEGYNGTIFAYGQTGTGKTHTMEGKDENAEMRGIIPNSFQYIFDSIQTMSDQKEFLVRASFLEIYNEEIRDLLGKDSKAKLELKESPDIGVYVKDLTSFVVKGVAEIDHVMQVGKKNRTVGATLMNQDSSRSHSIFTITIETSEIGPDGQAHIRAGKLNLVDLAGSERQSKTGATGDRLKEATKINLSLSALGNVISALVDGKSSHIPYRDSKLTRLLQDSLGGNTKTAMIATLSPADYNYDETLSTLRYANRAKNIKNKPRINEDPKDAMLREFQEEIKRLKMALEEQQRLQAGGSPSAGAGFGVAVPGAAGQTASLISPEEFAELQRKLAEAQNSRDVQVIQAGVSEEVLKQMEQEMQMKGAENQKLLARSAKLEARAEKLKAETLKFRAEAEKLASEREALLHERNRTEEEKGRIAEELDRRQREMESRQQELESMQAEVENERKEKEAIAVRLKAMEEKLLRGSEIIDKAKKQEAELRRAQFELEERKRQEMLLSRELAERQEAQLMAEEKFASLEEEVASQKQKMKKLWAKLQQSKTEVRDLSEEFQQEREDLLSTIRELTQEIKLKNLVIDNFIPPEEAQKIQRRAQWDDERQEWSLARIAHAGNNVRAKRPPSAVGLRRPVAESARVAAAMGDQNPRYRYENIINLELDMPERTTQDYEGAQGAQRMQAAINAAMADEQADEGAAAGPPGEAYGNVYYSYAPKDGAEGAPKPPRSNSISKGSARPSTATRKARPKSDEGPIAEEADPSQMYPQARGLVRK